MTNLTHMKYHNIKYHNVVLVRNGEFVGLYRFSGRFLCLWRVVNNVPYGKTSIIRKQIPADEYNGLTGKWYCNEVHSIPKAYKLDNKSHMEKLDSLLGGGNREVHKRILDNQPSRVKP